MKEYYRILQVDSQAEAEVIGAAYRRLMQKYHPDVLAANERSSEVNLRKVQDLNEAYEVLSDSQKRLEYDLLLAASRNQTSEVAGVAPSVAAQAKIEERVYLVRCAQTKRTFKMLLGRRQGWTGPFVIIRFEPLDDGEPASSRDGLGSKISAIFSTKRAKAAPRKDADPPTSDERIAALYDAANTLSMGEIDWAGHKCPDCAAERKNPNGTIGTFARCSNCHHIRCVGNAKKRGDGYYYTTCPWCQAFNRITYSIPTGSKSQTFLRGKFQEGGKQDLPHLAPRKSKPSDKIDKP